MGTRTTAAVMALIVVLAGLAGCTSGEDANGSQPGDELPPVGTPPEPGVLERATGPGLPGCGPQGTDPVSQIAPGDADGDGAPELFLACPGQDRVVDPEQGTVIALANASQPGGHRTSTSAAWGDADGDGCLDLYVGATGADGQGAENVLYRNDCQGNLTRVGTEAGVSLADPTRAVAWADYDLDGDLDLYVGNHGPGGAPNRLLTNDGNGTFTDLADEAQVAGNSATTAVVWLDVNLDRHPDLLTASEDAGLTLHQNLGDGTFLDITETAGLGSAAGLALSVGDVDRDGDVDLLAAGPAGLQLYRNEDDGTFTEITQAAGLAHVGPVTAAGLVDLDNDGWEDILALSDAADGPGALLFQNQRDGTWTEVTAEAGLDRSPRAQAGALVDLGEEGSLDLILAPSRGGLELWSNPEPPGRWIKLKFQGVQSNANGIGLRAVDPSFDRPHAGWVQAGSSALSTEAGLLHMGTGEVKLIGSIDLFWPSGILQFGSLVTTNSSATTKESPATKTSCPLVFVRDGEQIRFVSDVLGNSYIGWQVAPDRYMVPDPTERLRLGELTAVGGHYEVRIMEALEEINYLDQVRLVAVDHEPETEVVPDERFNVAPPHDDYGLVQLIDPQPVRAASTGDGRDVTHLVTERDGESPQVPRLPPPTFDGYAEEHSLVVDLGEIPSEGRVQLAAWAWIYYPMVTPQLVEEGPYIPLKAPILEALDPATDGWVIVTERPGFPAGMPKWWTLDLTDKLPEGATKVRFTTNLQIHWDQILVDTAPTGPGPGPSVHTAAPETADLHPKGYPQFIDGGPQKPGRYTYDEIVPQRSWDIPVGNYTRYGEVAPLLEEADDRFVIFPHGDELTILFDADAFPPVPDGLERTFFLDLDGFFKDMERYNAYPDTVEPLPFHGMSNYPYGPDEAYPDGPEHRAYQETWNTRTITSPDRPELARLGP